MQPCSAPIPARAAHPEIAPEFSPAVRKRPWRSLLLFCAPLLVHTGAGWADAERDSARERSRPAAAPNRSSAVAPNRAGLAAPEPVSGKSPKLSAPKDLRSLIDQDGKPFSFARLEGKTVVVNFIFTSCPVLCPMQTQALVGLQRDLPSALRSRVRFVSVTVDPDRDTAAALKGYALAMGADLSAWSFVTGARPELDWLYRYYSVLSGVRNGGQFDHQVGVYLHDASGRLMQRYTGDLDKPRLLREIAAIDSLYNPSNPSNRPRVN